MTALALTAILTAGPAIDTTPFTAIETHATVEAWEYDWYERSPAVARLQNLLGVEPDGVYGPDTYTAHGERLDWRGADDTRPTRPTRSTARPAIVDPQAVHSDVPPPVPSGVLDGVPYGDLIATYFPPEWHAWAARVMACESGGNPNARNPSGASGLFQQLAQFWAGRAAAAGWPGADVFDPEANIAVSAWLLATGGPQHWTCR